MNDEAFYNQVAEEIQANKTSPGLWTKAFAQAGGNTERTRAVYIKLRVAQLASEKRQSEKFVKKFAVKVVAGLMCIGCIFMSLTLIGVLFSEDMLEKNFWGSVVVIIFVIALVCSAIALLHKLRTKS
jgi:hypothetical protein